MKFPTQPRRQFLRFAETVRAFGCGEDEVGFERLLATIGTHSANRTPGSQGPVFSAPRAHAFTGPAGSSELEHAAA
jgi:hypothetical protein